MQTQVFGFIALLHAGVLPLHAAWSVAVHRTQVPVAVSQAGVAPLH